MATAFVASAPSPYGDGQAAPSVAGAVAVDGSAPGQTGPAAGTEIWRDPARTAPERVSDLLSRMTLAEKMAQLTAVWLLALAYGGTSEHISRMVPDLQYALGAWGRVQLLGAAPQEPSGGSAPADGDLTIRDLTFRYDLTSRYDTGDGDQARRPAAVDRKGP